MARQRSHSACAAGVAGVAARVDGRLAPGVDSSARDAGPTGCGGRQPHRTISTTIDKGSGFVSGGEQVGQQVHLFAAARLAYANDAKPAWSLYEQTVRDAWGGRVRQVIDTFKAQAERLGADASVGPDTRHVMKLAMEYVERIRERMDYPRYRRMGLPASSSLVESLIKQINLRVKGTEQFWLDGGLEAVPQVRAAYLSEDGRAEQFHRHRPRGPAVGRNRAKFLQPDG